MTARPTPSLVRRVALREWVFMAAGMLLLAIVLGSQNGLGRLDQSLYDRFLSASGRPARDDILIVAIDDYSLSALGRWPWPRDLHAQVIDRIAQARPRSIGLDVILSEPERPGADGTRPGDAALQRALARNRRTVLPVVTSNTGAGLVAAPPIAELANAALAIGHINLEHDADGVVRSVFLRAGCAGMWWPHFALALADPGLVTRVPTAATRCAPADGTQPSDGWVRTDQIYIPFAGDSGHFRSIPYVSVLRGEVPAQFFTGKNVLIGATALGMADAYPTPVSGHSGAMPGIEIHANVLASLLDGKAIVVARPWQTALFSALIALSALLAYLFYAPRLALAVTATLIAVTLAASYLALRAGVWIAPSAALITLLLGFPLWSWRRLEAAIAYLGQEFERLDQEPHLLPEVLPAASSHRIADVLERRIHAMQNAARRVRDLRQFVSDSLDNVPDATVVADIDGRILLTNRHANDYFTSIGIPALAGASLPELLMKLRAPQPIGPVAPARFSWNALFDLQHAAMLASGVSAHDADGRDLLIKSAPCHSAMNVLTGWIVSVIDISTIRAVERSRDETLRFLSHDMRAPQASILALLELQGDPSSAVQQEEFFSRIEKAARKTLGLADNFVQLARAESQAYRLEEVDFQDLLFDAVDEMWTLAKSRNIKLITDIADGEFPVRADRALMTRALVNLLSNAINYSPEHTRVLCTLHPARGSAIPQVFCSISDQGYGIAPEDQAKLFRHFERANFPHRLRHGGIGLGLVFVKTVVERHQGCIGFSSRVGEGTTFTMALPALADRDRGEE